MSLREYLLKPRLFAILIASYGLGGLVLLFYAVGAWNELIAPSVGLSWEEGVTISASLRVALLMGLLLFVVLYLISAERAHRESVYAESLPQRRWSFIRPAMQAGAINLVAFLVSFLAAWVMLRMSVSWTWMGYASMCGSLVGAITYLAVEVPSYGTSMFGPAGSEAKRGALRLEAEFCREAIHLLAWGSILLLTAVLAPWFFDLASTLPEVKRSLHSTELLLVNELLIVAYFAVGTYFGLIAQFVGRYAKIVSLTLETKD